MPDRAEFKPAVATLAVKCKYLSVRKVQLPGISPGPLNMYYRDSGLKNSWLKAAIYRYITPIDVV